MPEDTPTRSDVLRSLATYMAHFKAIDEEPEIDIRNRFLPLRAMRAVYFEHPTNNSARMLFSFVQKVVAGQLEPEDPSVLKQLETLMERADTYLTRYSRICSEDIAAANAPAVHPYRMREIFQPKLNIEDPSARAPNAELCAVYGRPGDPMKNTWMTLRGDGYDTLSRLILNRPVMTLLQESRARLWPLLNTIWGVNLPLESIGLCTATINTVVFFLEMVVVNICFEIATLVLYKTNSTGQKWILAPVVALACSFPISLLGPGAKVVYALNAGLWAVLIVIMLPGGTNMTAH